MTITAVVQVENLRGSPEHNVARVMPEVMQAAGIAVLPALLSCGYLTGPDAGSAAESLAGPTAQRLRGLSRSLPGSPVPVITVRSGSTRLPVSTATPHTPPRRHT
jgi:predicted amidohydrolase